MWRLSFIVIIYLFIFCHPSVQPNAFPVVGAIYTLLQEDNMLCVFYNLLKGCIYKTVGQYWYLQVQFGQ